MKRFIIAKLDTPLTLNEDSCQVPQAEPINLARYLAEAYNECEIFMIGIKSENQVHAGNNISVVPYFGNIQNNELLFDNDIASLVNGDTHLIIWQGRHCVTSKPKAGKPEGSLHLIEAEAHDFERVALRVTWHMQMHHLITSDIFENAKKYFVLTDVRLPLIDLGRIFPSTFRKLPEGIELLTQTYKVKEYLQYASEEFYDLLEPDANLVQYCYQHKSAEYLPFHLLPMMSHLDYNIDFEDKSDVVLFQTQSLRYYDGYRLVALLDAVKHNYEETIVISSVKDNQQERDFFDELFTDNEDIKADVQLISPKPGYFRAAEELSKCTKSIIVTEERYQKFGLCPNRLVEAILVGSIPILDMSVIENCEPKFKEIVQEYVKNSEPTNQNLSDFLSVAYIQLCDALKETFI